MLFLPKALLQKIHSHCLDAYPYECCGILVGRAPQGAAPAQAERIYESKNLNIERAADRYLMDPGIQFQAEREARRDGLEVLGFYHSHPDHPFAPSKTDLELAWEGYFYLIVSVRLGAPLQQKAWRLTPREKSKEFTEVPLQFS